MTYFAHPQLDTHILTHSRTFSHILSPHLLTTHSFSAFVVHTFFFHICCTQCFFHNDLLCSRHGGRGTVHTRYLGPKPVLPAFVLDFPIPKHKQEKLSVCFHHPCHCRSRSSWVWGLGSPVTMEVIIRNWPTDAFSMDCSILHWVGSGGRVHAVISHSASFPRKHQPASPPQWLIDQAVWPK